ncbi:hypothetical protein J2Z30_002149 [Streptomyces iranensis]|uniref:DUF397 domain-containing protein n=1 Tax=Streptomyces iranensis TaxID=576784 RepID=A0ABS4MP84_9ACTN|nr:hypothetical protein [Streptomyces iranensis]
MESNGRRLSGRRKSDLMWFKSSYSDNTGGECIEVATTPTTVHIRDSKNPDGPHLRIPATAWTDFLTTFARA